MHMALMETIRKRVLKLWEIEDVDVQLVALAQTYDLLLWARGELGDAGLTRLAEQPEKLHRVLDMLPVQAVCLRLSKAIGSVRYDVAEMSKFRLQESEAEAMEADTLKTLVPCALALKASLFLIRYDGVYLDYMEAGHPGRTVVEYEGMIGRRAIELLPDGMREIVQRHHDLAVSTGLPQNYEYVSPLTGRLMRSIVVPYPDLEQVALFVLEAEGALIPALC